MKEKIEELSNYIESLNIFTSWGGYCLLKSDEALPIGIGQYDKCKGNLYGFNEREISGFLYLKNIRTINKYFDITLGLYTFVPHKKIGENHNYYKFPMWLHTNLANKFKDYDFNLLITNTNRFIDREVAEIEINFKEFCDCETIIFNPEIC